VQEVVSCPNIKNPNSPTAVPLLLSDPPPNGSCTSAGVPNGTNGEIVQASYAHLHSTPIYWRGSGLTYLWPERDTLRAINYLADQGRFDGSSAPGSFCPTFIYAKPLNPNDPLQQPDIDPQKLPAANGAFMTLSADGDHPGTGVLWASTSDDNGPFGYPLPHHILRAFDAEPDPIDGRLHELWNSDSVASDRLAQLPHFVPPVVAAGRVFMVTWDGVSSTPSSHVAQVQVYGLRSGQ
jgi:hypothetical protein